MLLEKGKFKYIDLFAGIGGFHIAMDNLGGECVFASEWDNDCRKTYEANFKKKNLEIFKNRMYVGDITKIDPNTIPDHDVLCAGFPCQPFSQAGYKRGFSDTRGTLFFNVASIINAKRPKVNSIKTREKLLDRIKKIKSYDNVSIEFDSVVSPTFNHNLLMIDSLMLRYLGNALLYSYEKTIRILEKFL